jgi:hypothetical protein
MRAAAAARAAAFAASLVLAFAFVPAGCSSSPRFPSCERDDQCTTGATHDYCVDGRCVFCRTSVDCGDRQRCRAGACEPDPNAPPPPPDAGADAEDDGSFDEDDAGDVPSDEDDHAPPESPRRILPRGIRRFFGP